jgi:hypothetical protein
MASAEVSTDVAAPDEQQALLAQLRQAFDACDCDAVVALMRANVPHGQVQLAGCRALIKLCAAGEDGCTDELRASALEALTATLQAHNGVATVEQCFTALLSLFRARHVGPDTAAFVSAVTVVVACLRKHCMDATLLEWGFLILLQLLRASPELIAAAAHADIFTAVAVGMHAHAAVPDVQRTGCQLLGKLTYQNAEHQRLAVQAGACCAVLAALRTHGASDAWLAASGCGALCTFTAGNNTLCQSLTCSDIGLLMALITQYAEDETVQQYALISVSQHHRAEPCVVRGGCSAGCR